MKRNMLHGKIRALRYRQFTAGDYIQPYPLLRHQPGDQRRQVGLRSIEYLRRRGMIIHFKSPEIALTGINNRRTVKNVEWRTILLNKLRNRATGYMKYPIRRE